MSHIKSHHPNCLNCHYPLAEFDAFCPNCGQKPISPKSSMHDLLHEFFHTFWHLDGKFFMTLHHLLIPGKLTTEFFKGHLKRYAHPIQLFLVLGAFVFGLIAAQTAKIETDTEESMQEKRDKYKRKDFLKELDSVRHTLIPPQYSDATMKRLSDSLMFKMIYKGNTEIDKNKLEKQTDDILNKEFDKRYRGGKSRNKVTLSIGKDSTNLNAKFVYEDDAINERREAFKDSILDALIGFDANSFNARITKKMDSLKAARQGKSGFDEKIERAKIGYEIGVEDEANQRLLTKLQAQIEAQKRKQDLKEAIKMSEDTNNIGVFGKTLKIPNREVYELSPDSILTKYHVEGFWQKTMTKQALKTMQNPSSLIHFYMGKLFWATVLLIPVTALFFSLVYRRSKRFYVEHVIFLLHFNTAAFLILIPTLWLSKYFDWLYVVFPIWFGIHFIASVKGYYRQSWGKTLLKSAIIGFAYIFLAFFLITLMAIIGFIFF